MPEANPPPPPADEEEQSPLSQRLRSRVSDEPPAQELPANERKRLAEGKLNATLKGWRLVKLLGVGPVTAAYEAVRGAKDAKEHATLRLMIGNVAKHEGARSVFLRGAYAANRFNHSRVLPIVEDGVDEDSVPFVVRPWADAVPLDEFVKDAPMEEKRVLRLAEQVLDALEMAHAHGILHGAIHPGNVLVNSRGSIRLCDFSTPPGLGSTRTTAGDEALTGLRASPFVAPERVGVGPQPPSETSDVYSVAACLYYALTRTAPRVDAHSRVAVKPLREVNPACSESVALILEHALEIDPVKRYESAYAMLGDVRRAMAGRRPKLGDATSPVPSQSMQELPQVGPPSSRRFPSSSAMRDALPKSQRSGSLATLRERRRRETRGNVLLILAIALLVGIATFVLIREKRATEEKPPATAP
jgi:serine/threonine-protein kinase